MPLSSKEFTQGILRPLGGETMDHFLSQRWDRRLVLPLMIGGVSCSNGSVVINGGSDPHLNWDFVEAAEHADGFSLSQTSPAPFAALRMSAEKAAVVLKDGLGEGKTVTAITPYDEWQAQRLNGRRHEAQASLGDQVVVEIAKKGSPKIEGFSLNSVCAAEPAADQKGTHVTAASILPGRVAAHDEPSAGAKSSHGLNVPHQEELLLRSVESIFYYLAEITRLNLEADYRRCGILRPQAHQESARQLLKREHDARVEIIDRMHARASSAAAMAREEMQAAAAKGPDAGGLHKKAELEQARADALAITLEAAKNGSSDDPDAMFSVEDGIIGPQDFFRIRMACEHEAPPLRTAVSTTFQGRDYYILHGGSADPGDRTLEVLSFLSVLIALQTSESSIQAASPIIAIAP
ncbi:hypothetical protein C7I55_08305 [Sphingomonas deserti]|uniref:Uncharacterized protein n=1 Tax=Allosphingosinicella deserti TaxID=2116704 RepID=A0A2P7QW97_9SPHN|nr:hypothetical protein C7I55_08305 [Sphingomonas deserti]